MPSIKKIPIENLEFDCRVSGNEQNELILFLHGFPETSIMWEKLMGKFSSLGFYCIAPDMRGYSKNACPKGVKNYTLKKLGQDILNLADAVGKNKFHLVGHDWGAGIGWYVVFNNHDRILSWTGLSVPHMSAFGKAIRLDKDQQKRSRYIKGFLLPLLPEMMLRQNNFQKFKRLWAHSSPEEVENYLSVFRKKKSLTAALNYYRANIGKSNNDRVGDIEAPTLFIWGQNDFAIGSFAVESGHKYMKGPYTFLALHGGHWLIQTNYPEVETAVITHISSYSDIPNNTG